MLFLFNLTCIVRPVSQMLLLHLAIWAFLFIFFDIQISDNFSLMEHSIIKYSVSAKMTHHDVSSIIFFICYFFLAV